MAREDNAVEAIDSQPIHLVIPVASCLISPQLTPIFTQFHSKDVPIASIGARKTSLGISCQNHIPTGVQDRTKKDIVNRSSSLKDPGHLPPVEKEPALSADVC
jgi:hypothetical protein